MFGEYHIAQKQGSGLAQVSIRQWAQGGMHKGIVF